MSTPSLHSIKETTEKAVGFVEWLVQLLRCRKWVTMLLLLDVLLVLFFNPLFLSSIPEFLPKGFLPKVPALPEWYPPIYWLAVGLVSIAALLVAYRTVPRKAATPAADLTEHKALKFLRPFGFEDAETFTRLQREGSLRECLLAITDREFRYGILCGDSGCGKTSFLQAGLWPALLKHKVQHHCIYVKFTDLDPLESVHQTLAEKFPLPQENPEGGNLLTLFGKVVPSGSQPLVLLFDQFEQFFVHRKRKEDREPFVQALAEWYKSKSPLPVKILISLRGDFLDRLIELQKRMGYSPGPQQSIRLEKFTAKEATAIFRVIAETEDLPFDEGFVEELAEKELASREDSLISAVDLQILAWMIKGRRTEEERAFNRTAFRKLGGLEGLLEHFLSRSLRVRETKTQRPAAINVLLALTDLERNARAGVLTSEQIAEKLAGTVSTDDIQEAVDWLARERLITPVETDTAQGYGPQGYELAHERLIPALRRLADKEPSEANQTNQLLERRVHEWLGNDRARRYLLTWRELRRIQRQKPYLEWGANKDHKEALIAQSRRQLHWRAGGSAFAVLLAISSLGWWYSPWGQIWLAEQELERAMKRVGDTQTIELV